MLLKLFIFLLSIALILNCSGDVTKDKAKTNNSTSPKQTLEMYWHFSSIGDFSKSKNLTTAPPKSFLLCYANTPSECKQKLAEYTSNKNTKENSVELMIDSDNIVVEKIPKGIFNGGWNSFSVEKEEVQRDQARIRIKVQGKGFTLIRDVLLVRLNEEWKIFEFVSENENEAYANPLSF